MILPTSYSHREGYQDCMKPDMTESWIVPDPTRPELVLRCVLLLAPQLYGEFLKLLSVIPSAEALGVWGDVEKGNGTAMLQYTYCASSMR